MILHWPWIGLAVVLLIPPPLLSADLRRVMLSTRRNASLGVTALARPWQNWIDFARALIGSLVLIDMGILADPDKNLGGKVVATQGAILAVATLVQIVRLHMKASREDQRIQLIAPVFYLCGVTIVLNGVVTGGFAVFVGWLFAMGARSPIYQIPVMGAGLVLASCFFGLSASIYWNVALILMPFLLSFVLRKRPLFVGLENPLATAPA